MCLSLSVFVVSSAKKLITTSPCCQFVRRVSQPVSSTLTFMLIFARRDKAHKGVAVGQFLAALNELKGYIIAIYAKLIDHIVDLCESKCRIQRCHGIKMCQSKLEIEIVLSVVVRRAA